MLEVLVGGASECCTSFYDTDGPQEPEVLHGSGRPTVGQFVKVGSELLESGVCHLQVLRAPVRVEEIKMRCLSICATAPRVRVPSDVRVASRCREHTHATLALSVANQSSLMMWHGYSRVDHLDLIFLNPNRGSRARKAFANLKMTHTGFQEFRTNFYELAHGGGICENLKEKFYSFYFRRPLPRAVGGRPSPDRTSSFVNHWVSTAVHNVVD
ncbi:hypothetical protein E4U47_006723 [Claviceps purpurea]|nr:hypothetical protein E4U47_006723 [Claviceps purpurea]